MPVTYIVRAANRKSLAEVNHELRQASAGDLYNDAGVRLTIRNELASAASGTDDTAGTPGLSTVNGGYGLTGMRERLRMLGGTLEAGREDDCWVVSAYVPLTVR